MKKLFSSFLIIGMLLSVWVYSVSAAAVFTVPGGAHHNAPLDPVFPFFELTMRTQARDADVNNQGRETQSLMTKGTGWDVIEYGNLGNYNGVPARDFISYTIQGTVHAADTPWAINAANEVGAINITKAFGAGQQPVEGALNANDAVFQTAYAANKTAQETNASTYIRFTNITMTVRSFAFGAPVNRVIYTYNFPPAAVSAAQIGMIIGDNNVADNGNQFLGNTVCNSGTPRLVIGVWLPKFFEFIGISWKFGIQFLGLTCPQSIRVAFYRVAKSDYDAGTQIENIAAANRERLNSQTIVIARNNLLWNILFSYPYPGTPVFDTIGDQSTGNQAGDRRDWEHVYRLEYTFDGTNWLQGATRQVTAAGGTNCDNLEIYYSPNQGRFHGPAVL